MNKLKIAVLSGVLGLALCAPSYAGQAQGKVQSVDAAGNTIVIVDPVSGASQKVRVHPNVIATVKTGDPVKATLISGSDEAQTFEVLLAK